MANYRKSFNLRNGVQVDDDNFIVNPNGLVGIGTTVPTEFLDVRGNAKVVGLTTTNTLYAGIATVGVLTVTQGVVVTGVVTATTFSGSALGLTDIYAIAVDGWYVTSGSISTTSNVGIGTTLPQGKLQIGTAVTFSSNGNATYSGIITASSFSGSGVGLTALPSEQLTGTINNARLPSNINVSGIITAQTHFNGNLVGIASTANSITNTANITVNSINSGFSTTGVSTAFTSAYVGTSGTAFAALNSGRIGIGTALPTSEIQVRKASGSLVEVVSDSGQARISVGQSVGAGKSTGVIRFGSSAHDFDIINNDNEGNINFLLNGNSLAGSGKFSWQNGNGFTEAMRLNANGDFSVSGVTTLASNGGITTTGGALYVNNNLSVGGTISATDITLPSVISSTNLNNNSGITTVAEIHIVGDSRIGIGSTAPIANIDGIGKTAYLGKVAVGYDDATADINTYNLAVDGKIGATEGIFAPSFNFTVASGIVTAFGGFVSYGSTAVQIFVEGSTLRFNVVGIGSTTLALI